mmetsp:Transcript_6346/g.18156  ORF Transcript_6346/g.18156 Transcript_6346/m.18156 type:complete len:210 (-) Transcript_6346:843-1472(-)
MLFPAVLLWELERARGLYVLDHVSTEHSIPVARNVESVLAVQVVPSFAEFVHRLGVVDDLVRLVGVVRVLQHEIRVGARAHRRAGAGAPPGLGAWPRPHRGGRGPLRQGPEGGGWPRQLARRRRAVQHHVDVPLLREFRVAASAGHRAEHDAERADGLVSFPDRLRAHGLRLRHRRQLDLRSAYRRLHYDHELVGHLLQDRDGERVRLG